MKYTELSLSGGQYRSQMSPRHRWQTTAYTMSAAAGGGQGAQCGIAWGDRGLKKGERGSKHTTMEYNVWSHEGDKGPVVELYPMEIRTFEVTLS